MLLCTLGVTTALGWFKPVCSANNCVENVRWRHYDWSKKSSDLGQVQRNRTGSTWLGSRTLGNIGR